MVTILLLGMPAPSLLDHRRRVLALGFAYRALIAGVGQMTYIANPGLGVTPLRLEWSGHLSLSPHPPTISLRVTKGKSSS